MATRDVLKTDSIDFLIYKGERGEHRGYRRELLTEETHDKLKKFIFCCECDGISRKPRLAEGNTICTPCSKSTRDVVDSRVDEIVLQLKSRCPLSTRGCDWSGQLGDIAQHMSVCVKLRVACVIGCGEVLERCEVDGHLKKCPFRREQCEYCGEGVQASDANRHIALCPKHPDGVVSCPYKELGCDVLGIKKKDLDRHLADDSISHQKLMLREIHQLRSENDKLRDTFERKECGNFRKFQYLKRRDVMIHKNGWMLLALAVLGIAILVSCVHVERDRVDVNILSNKQSIQSNEQSIQSHEQFIQSHEQSIQSNKQSLQSHEQSIQSNKDFIQSNKDSIQSNKQSIQSNKDCIQSNKQSIQSNKQSIQSNKDSIQSHDQSMRFILPSTVFNTTYLYDYIQERNKTLRGVGWTHRNVAQKTYYGPIFYLGTCRLRLHVYVYASSFHDDRTYVVYYVTRLRGDYDDVSDTCHITYVHLSTVNTDNSRDNVSDLSVSKKLNVGDVYYINRSFYIYADIAQPIRIIRIYFDFE